MKRSAILIAGDKMFQQGVEAMDEFLRSSLGGEWRGEEIIRSDVSKQASILSAITAAQAKDFSLVYFIGKGETRKFDLPWQETRIQLSSGETVMERALNPGTPRCSLIFDCSGGPSLKSDKTIRLATNDYQETPEISNWARSAYDEAMCAAEAGLVKVLATLVGQKEGIEKTFTQRLIEAATEWAVECHGVLSYADAVAKAARSFVQEVPDGHAEYRGGRRLRDFPFGVHQ